MMITKFLRDVAIHETQWMGFLDNVPRIFAGSIVFSSHRDNLLAGEFPSQLLELFLSFAQFYKEKIIGIVIGDESDS